MERIITAIGNEELNNILKEQKNLYVESSDIQYKEGVIEALEKYSSTDIVIIKDDIIGEMTLEELIFRIILIKKDIKMVLVTEKREFEDNKNIVKIVYDKNNYVNIITSYLTGEIYIKSNNATKYTYEVQNKSTDRRLKKSLVTQKILDKLNKYKEIIKQFLKKQEKKSKIITFIGSSGSRKNNSCFYFGKVS